MHLKAFIFVPSFFSSLSFSACCYCGRFDCITSKLSKESTRLWSFLFVAEGLLFAGAASCCFHFSCSNLLLFFLLLSLRLGWIFFWLQPNSIILYYLFRDIFRRWSCFSSEDGVLPTTTVLLMEFLQRGLSKDGISGLRSASVCCSTCVSLGGCTSVFGKEIFRKWSCFSSEEFLLPVTQISSTGLSRRSWKDGGTEPVEACCLNCVASRSCDFCEDILRKKLVVELDSNVALYLIATHFSAIDSYIG